MECRWEHYQFTVAAVNPTLLAQQQWSLLQVCCPGRWTGLSCLSVLCSSCWILDVTSVFQNCTVILWLKVQAIVDAYGGPHYKQIFQYSVPCTVTVTVGYG